MTIVSTTDWKKSNSKMRIITINVPFAYVDKFDELTDSGLIASRSGAIREAICDWFVKMAVVQEKIQTPTVQVIEHFLGEQMISAQNNIMEWSQTVNQAGKLIEQWKCIGRVEK